MGWMPCSPNVCAGLYGVVYDFLVERPRLMNPVARAIWGIELSVLYASMAVISRVGAGATVLDVPCGGGVAFRALCPDQDVRYVAGDVSGNMLARARRHAERRSLTQVEFALADMLQLPFADEEADLFLSYSGLHIVADPERAVSEIARCLRPGGELVGTTILSEGSRRQRALFGSGHSRGYALPPSHPDLYKWLVSSGIVEPVIEPQSGFAVFRGHKQLR
jgi:ubiquinone/menaquinone biosynthesis C-methylase UbiE